MQKNYNMTNTQELVLDSESFDNVLAMFDSSDLENMEIVIEALNNVSVKENFAFILFLMKESKRDPDIWPSRMTSLVTEVVAVSGLNIPDGLTFKSILKQFKKTNNTVKDINFFMKRFARHMRNVMLESGYEVVNDIEIIVKLKSNEQLE